MNTEVALPNKKRAKWTAISATCLYVLLFPISVMMWGFSGMVFDSPSMTQLVGWSFIFFMFLIPLSIPISIYFLWSSYRKGLYKKSRFFCLLPLMTTAVVFAIVTLIDFLFNTFVRNA